MLKKVINNYDFSRIIVIMILSPCACIFVKKYKIPTHAANINILHSGDHAFFCKPLRDCLLTLLARVGFNGCGC